MGTPKAPTPVLPPRKDKLKVKFHTLRWWLKIKTTSKTHPEVCGTDTLVRTCRMRACHGKAQFFI